MRKNTGPVRRGVMGAFTIFGPKVKDADHRLQGIMTIDGMKEFERSRARLGQLYKSLMGRDAVRVSDADTIEFLARGELATVKYLRAIKKIETAA